MEQPIRLTFAARLRELMRATPALDTQAKLGRASGIAQSTVGRILRGEVAATLDNVQAIAHAFGRPTTDLLVSESQRMAGELHRLMTRLSPEDAAKVTHFAQFVASQKTTRIAELIEIDTESSFGDHSRAIEDAAQRPVRATLGEDDHAKDSGTERRPAKRV